MPAETVRAAIVGENRTKAREGHHSLMSVIFLITAQCLGLKTFQWAGNVRRCGLATSTYKLYRAVTRLPTSISGA